MEKYLIETHLYYFEASKQTKKSEILLSLFKYSILFSKEPISPLIYLNINKINKIPSSIFH